MITVELDPLQAFALVAGVFGLVIGSFLNVVVHRLPREASIVSPGSHCPHCARPIRPLENIPLVSFALLRGRCRGCRARIGWRYPAVEALCALLFAAIAWRYGPSALALLWMAFGAALLAAGLIDLDHGIIPDQVSLGGLVAGLLLAPAARAFDGAAYAPALAHSLLGALVGGGLLWGVGFLHARLAVALGREFEHWPGAGEAVPGPRQLDYWIWFPGMGFGDIKLLAMIGAFVGPVGVIHVIVAAALAGLGLGLAVALGNRRADVPFGFGPAIAFGALLVVIAPASWLLGPGLIE